MGQLSNLTIYRLRKWMARYRFLFPSTMTPLSDISPKTVTQQEFLLFHIIPYYPCSSPGTTTVQKKSVLTCIIKGHTSLQCHYSSLLKAAGCLRGALETCSGASDLSTARPNRWPGLHRTVGFKCYLLMLSVIF